MTALSPAAQAQFVPGGGGGGGNSGGGAGGGSGNGKGGNRYTSSAVGDGGQNQLNGVGGVGGSDGAKTPGGGIGTNNALNILSGTDIFGGAGGTGIGALDAGGGGGGAGAYLLDAGSLTSGVNITGGAGGGSISGQYGSGGGGGGGAGLMYLNRTLTSTLTIGASLTGGAGGSSGNYAANGAGGSGGGGGGSGLYVSTTGFTGAATSAIITVNNNSTITGGKGGHGSNPPSGPGSFNSGGGGGGGAGISMDGSWITLSNSSSGTIRGGAGGGGDRASVGYAGGGGTGVVFSGSNSQINNSGLITGGNAGTGLSNAGGGAGIAGAGGISNIRITNTATGTINGGNGHSGSSPSAGQIAGGAGIIGSNLYIQNAGAIRGGLAGNGTTRANAVTFTGGTNTLEILSTSVIVGNVQAGSADTFILAGATGTTFNAAGFGTQYNGFGHFIKTGDSIWTLTNTTAATTPWVIQQGVLSIAQNGSLGAPGGALTLDGGTLQATATFSDSTRPVTITANNGSIDVTGSNALTLNGAITGAGALTKVNSGALVLTGNNSYAGGTTISGGTLQLGNGGASGSVIGNIADNGTLVFNRSNALSLSGLISGTGVVNQNGPGSTTLTGDNSYTGATNVNAGALYINGNQSAATGLTSVASGATLGGTGTIGGDVAISGGTLAPGNPGSTAGTLTINGNLSLNSSSNLNYRLGQANVAGGPLNDLTNVGGNLTLAGTLNVTQTPGGSFLPGLYRIFNYNGTLTNNGLTLNTPPGTTEFLQTSVPGQVNLINTTNLTLNYWDGDTIASKNNQIVNGGDGVWLVSTNDNWTTPDGLINAPYSSGSFAIFQGQPGTVTVDNGSGQVISSGMQFAVNGYLITGAPIDLRETTAGTGMSIIRVGDGTSAGAASTATINAVLQGNVGLEKNDLGTLVLGGVNTYTGGTAINGGTLQISRDANLGDIAGALSLDSGTLATTASFATSRATTLNAGGGVFDIATDTTLTMNGVIDGAGALTKTNSGTLLLTGNNAYTGATSVNAGTLLVGDAATPNAVLGGTGAGMVTVAQGATLAGTGTVTGPVTNKGTVAALNTLPDHTTDPATTFTLAGGLTNSGTVNLAGSAVGNQLVIQGNYVGNNGTLILNTVLGNDSSPTDKLVIDGGNASGTTDLVIKRAGSNGAQTNQGIRVVQTANGGTTDPAAFVLSSASDGYRAGVGTIVAGAYDYRLTRGGVGGVADDWYLTSVGNQCASNIALCPPPPEPGNGPAPKAALRPEVGSYLNNRLFAQTMQFHTLHERQGQAPGRVGKDLQQSSDANVWLRIESKDNSRDGAEQMALSGNSYLLHLGGDIARISDGHNGSLRFGVMGAYGYQDNRASNERLSSRGTVDGYNAGVYATWYGHQDILSGPYIDSWLMYGTFHNQVNGQGLPTESYRSSNLAASVEGGYAFQISAKTRTAMYLAPQAQVIVSDYRAGTHTEQNGTEVSAQSGTSVTTRLGVRLYGDLKDTASMHQIRPFAEANWWHGPGSQSATFDGMSIRDDLPKDRFEGKLGLQASLTRSISIWGSVGFESGSHGYAASNAQIGVKSSW